MQRQERKKQLKKVKKKAAKQVKKETAKEVEKKQLKKVRKRGGYTMRGGSRGDMGKGREAQKAGTWERKGGHTQRGNVDMRHTMERKRGKEKG